ncbi:ATP-binding cassette domain-containing protein [Marinifilum caeruleilacunae]|uniref:ATP-binding cassette domain-containing protein n=1 Tax=Marinifilum caeruleilacunae TaxID=2499076 RepID=A0ABX1WSV7_9BACT|nr:ATP-binding cassette domain-containing protein [Marinifilum caeruleilacunae]NOU59077.1 ATP-binding cassette domain-containing protein [Marinifilum caeruleilacunae]
MNESLLKALMQLFAIIVDEQKLGFETAARDVVEVWLQKQFSKEWTEKYLEDFDRYLKDSHCDETGEVCFINKHPQVQHVCEKLVEEVEQEQKVWIMLQLLEFIDETEYTGHDELDLVKTVSKTFNIPKKEFELSRQFIIGDELSIPFNEHLLLIDNNEEWTHEVVRHIHSEKLRGRIFILHLESTNTFLMKYFGEYNLFLNGHNIKVDRAYLLSYGSVIRSHRIDPIYYSQISSIFIEKKNLSDLQFVAKNIEFKFPGSNNGIHPVSLEMNSGQLVGIMGGSGTGKSTLLNVLNGNLSLRQGNIYINGYDLHLDKEKLQGVIGYVPQDDLLVEELTVYENLYFNAKLCFDDTSDEKIEEIIDKTIEDFDLVEARDLKVGDPINKVLSGGQRKRLNIALELMREPSVLLVDEPTSGLSSMDSEKVMLLLKRQVLKGKLVICNIHQPSSDIFKLLDKLVMMDQGGKVIYFGNPIDAVVYFKTQSHYVKADESECLTCGNVNSEQILRIIEARMMNEYGKQIRKRKRSSDEWYDLYKENIEKKNKVREPRRKKLIPQNFFSIPKRWDQLKIYLSRDIKSKLSNRQYMLITLLEAPLLAVILGYFTKYISGTDADHMAYVFSKNENIPSFIFMAVVVALFLGLIISAEEILHDRRMMKREQFLNLSRSSYLNSKVIVLLVISAIQTFLFVILANSILEIKGLTWEYWLILYTASACANLIGLNLSAGLNSVVAVYVSIPFILVPQLLFSGVIVNFNKLHPAITSQKYVPIVGDLMTSRWAYEALVVEQFSNNEFEKQFFSFEQAMSESSFRSSFLIPEIQENYKAWLKTNNDKHYRIFKNELLKLSDVYNFPTHIEFTKKMLKDSSETVNMWLEQVKQAGWKEYNSQSGLRDKIYGDMIDELGDRKKMIDFKNSYHNEAIEQIALNRRELNKLIRYEDELIQLKDPVFQTPNSTNGRAHLFASQKRLGNYLIDTFWFNVIIIWLTTIIFYFSLYFDVLRRFLLLIEILWVTILPEGDIRIRRKRQK